MNRTTLPAMFSAVFAPHARAADLIDARLGDAGATGGLEPADAAWLDAHLAGCPRCREVQQGRASLRASLGALGREAAPTGFAGRVLIAARARGRAEEPAVASSWRPFELAAGLAAAGLVVFAMVSGRPGQEAARSPSEALSGGSALSLEDTQHFVVRAPGLGAAKARVQATEVVVAHGGTYAERGGAIVARIPRAALVPVAQDLARRSAFRMTKVDDVELPADAQTVVIRFELE